MRYKTHIKYFTTGTELNECESGWSANLIVENENNSLKDADGCEDETIDDTVLILRNKLINILNI